MTDRLTPFLERLAHLSVDDLAVLALPAPDPEERAALLARAEAAATRADRLDELRAAPGQARAVLGKEFAFRAYDPEATETARSLFGDRITLCEKSYDALGGADALVVVTEWNTFREPDFEKMRTLLRSPVVFDGRNVYSPEQMRGTMFFFTSSWP